MAKKSCFLFVLLPILFYFFTACSESDGTGTSTMPSAEDNRVFLISQAAAPCKNTNNDNKENLIAESRKWSYSVDWRVKSYHSINDTITFLENENGNSGVIGTISVSYVSYLNRRSVIIFRKSGSIQMDDLSLTITGSSSPLNLRLISSGDNHLVYEYESYDEDPSDLVHHLTLSNLDIMKTDEINFIYEVQNGYNINFASPLMASLSENGPLFLGLNENNQKTLEQHLVDFFTGLFSGEDKTHFFSIEVDAKYQVTNEITTSIPVVLVPYVASSDLDTFVPSLSSAIKTFIDQAGGDLYYLQFSVNIFGGSEAENNPILRLTDVLLKKDLVSDFN